MKKLGFILYAIGMNVTLLFTVLTTFDFQNNGLEAIMTRPENMFTPDPVINTMLIGSFFGLIIFNYRLIKRK
jgi:hypothetical protein